MALVEKAGLFAPVDAATLEQVPDAVPAGDGHWTGIAARSTVFVYNKTLLSAPSCRVDAGPGRSPSGRAAGRRRRGRRLPGDRLRRSPLKGEEVTARGSAAMKTNALAYRGNCAAMKAVNAGEVDAAVIYHYYYFGDQAKTGENAANVGAHYFRNQDPGAFARCPVAAC